MKTKDDEDEKEEEAHKDEHGPNCVMTKRTKLTKFAKRSHDQWAARAYACRTLLEQNLNAIEY